MNTLKYFFTLVVFPFLFSSCDLNEYPPEIDDQEFDIEEYSPAGALVGIIVALDNDEDQVITYEIVQASEEGIFDIDPSDGSLYVANSEKLDYEQIEKVILIISATDSHRRNPLESTAEVQVNVLKATGAVPKHGLIAFYPFEGNANDVSGNEIHGEVHGASLTTDRFENANSAYQFDGVDDYIRLTNESSMHFGNNDFTISAWYSLATDEPAGRGQAIISTYHASGDREYILAVHPTWDTIYMKIYNQGGLDGNRVHAENSLGWHMVTVTKNSSHLKIYMDGKFEDETIVTAEIIQAEAAVMIGALHHSTTSPDYFFNGKIDDVSVHNRVLEDREILNLYQIE